MAMTLVDLVTTPALVEKSWDYFRNVQTRDTKYQPLISAQDKPAIWLNKKIMEQYREQMRKLYYDPSKHDTYLEQLGIRYPTVRDSSAASQTKK